MTPLSVFGNPMNIWKYFRHGEGILSSSAADMVFFGASSKEYVDTPDLQITSLTSAADRLLFTTVGKVTPEAFEHEVGVPMDYSIFAQGLLFGNCLQHPKERGSVTLRSTSVSDNPIVTYELMGNDYDLERLIKSIRILEDWLAAPSLASLQPQILPHRKLAQEFGYGTDEYWVEYIRRFITTLWHPVGTCAMGAKNDGKSVVNSRLQVWGFEGLRVADASIMPDISSGNTNAPTGLIGLKSVDIILKEHTGMAPY